MVAVCNVCGVGAGISYIMLLKETLSILRYALHVAKLL